MEKKFQVKSGGTLFLDADEGDVYISGTEKDEAIVSVSTNGSDSRINRYHISIEQDGQTIRVVGKESRHNMHWFHNEDMQVRFNISLPSKFNLDIHTSGGDMTVEHIEGLAKGGTSGGNLELTDLKGDVRLETSGGDIRVTKTISQDRWPQILKRRPMAAMCLAIWNFPEGLKKER
jgi:hypothetical protein